MDGSSAPLPKKNLGPRRAYIANNAYRNSASGQDFRTYDFVVGLHAVTSTDSITADIYPFDTKFIGAVATRIINEVKGVNRVVYDVTSKPPGTIEWE